MGRVRYSMIVSLDGYIEGPSGGINLLVPDDDVHQMANQEAREASAFLFGRRTYEVMEEPWTRAANRDDLPDVEAEFARAYVETPRIVFSDTLEEVPAGVQLVRRQDAEAEVARLKRQTEGDLILGGASLAASLVELIDDFRLYVMPVFMGVGKPFFAARETLQLRLADHRAFASGAMYLRYERAG